MFRTFCAQELEGAVHGAGGQVMVAADHLRLVLAALRHGVRLLPVCDVTPARADACMKGEGLMCVICDLRKRERWPDVHFTPLY
jgi:hypothetical protein